MKLWDVAAGREVHTLTGHANIVTSLAFSPDGRWLATGSWDKTIKIWDVQTGLGCKLWWVTTIPFIRSLLIPAEGG